MGLAGLVALALFRRRGRRVVAWIVLATAVACVSALVLPGPQRGPTGASAPPPAGFPADNSVLVYLFLDRGAVSREVADRVEQYRRALPHRIHVLCFVEGVAPAPLMADLRRRFHVDKLPAAVFNSSVVVDAGQQAAVEGTLDRQLGKPPPRLSMEMHGGVIAGRQLSLGFIMCNHGSRTDARGRCAMFVFENGVSVDGWTCDHAVRGQVADGRPFAIPIGKCQPPALSRWDIPEGIDHRRIGALTVILDERGAAIDSICTEKPCARTGVCD